MKTYEITYWNKYNEIETSEIFATSSIIATGTFLTDPYFEDCTMKEMKVK